MKQSWWVGPLLAAPVTLWVLAAFAAPLVMVVVLAFQDSSEPFAPLSLMPSLTQFAQIFADDFVFKVLLQTTAIAVAVAIASAIFGYPLALWLVRMPTRWRPIGFAIVLIPLLTNVVVRSLGIVLLLAPDGIINWVLARVGLPQATTLLYTYGAVCLGLLQVFMPFMVLALYDVLQSASPRVREAAASLGATPFRRFAAIDLPLSLPGLATGLSIVFLMGSSAYVSASMLGGKKVLTTGMLVWQEALQNLNGPMASALSLSMMVIGLVMSGLIAVVFRRLTPWLALRPARPVTLPLWAGRGLELVGPTLGRLALGVALLLLLLPLVLILVQSFNDVPQATVAGFRHFTWRWYAEVLGGGVYLDSFLVSVRLAASTAAVSLMLATAAAFCLARTPFPGRGLLATLWMLPLTLPHVAIGVGMLRLLQVYTALPPFLGLVGVHVVLVLPFTIALLRASVLQLDRSQEEAAESLGARPLARIFLVILPGLAPGLVAAGVVSFLLSFEEVTVTSFLTTARLTTLPVRIYAEASFSLEPTVHAVSTLLIVMTVIAIAIVSRFVPIDRVFAR